MTTTTIPVTRDAPDARADQPSRSVLGGRLSSLVRRSQDDAAWVRPALLGLLGLTALLYLWNLSASGYGNAFYAAAVQAGSTSWKEEFAGSNCHQATSDKAKVTSVVNRAQ